MKYTLYSSIILSTRTEKVREMRVILGALTWVRLIWVVFNLFVLSSGRIFFFFNAVHVDWDLCENVLEKDILKIICIFVDWAWPAHGKLYIKLCFFFFYSVALFFFNILCFMLSLPSEHCYVKKKKTALFFRPARHKSFLCWCWFPEVCVSSNLRFPA